MGGHIAFAIITASAACLVAYIAVDWVVFRLRAPRIQLRCPSGPSWGAKFWNSSVWYDVTGTPYAGAKDIGSVRLLPNGKTDDHIYRTTWVHLSGPQVDFERPPPKPPSAA